MCFSSSSLTVVTLCRDYWDTCTLGTVVNVPSHHSKAVKMATTDNYLSVRKSCYNHAKPVETNNEHQITDLGASHLGQCWKRVRFIFVSAPTVRSASDDTTLTTASGHEHQRQHVKHLQISSVHKRHDSSSSVFGSTACRDNTNAAFQFHPFCCT
eukprot:6471243-Amphidinium_carterae.1